MKSGILVARPGKVAQEEALMFKIYGNSEYATLNASIDEVRLRLAGNPAWTAEVLKLSGDYGWRVKWAEKLAKGILKWKTLEEREGGFLVWGLSGKKHFLAYLVQGESSGQIRITPLGFLPRIQKVKVAVTLALLFIAPALLAPLLWKVYEWQTWRASRIHLPALCRFLLD